MPGEWEHLASREGGTVVSFATAPTGQGGATLFAATAAGLFRSEDGGRAWSAGSERPLPLLVAVAASARFVEHHLIFAGTQTGFHRSTDAGRTWRQTLSGGRVFTIAVVLDEGPEERVFIGTQRDGILRSDDGGRTWAGANAGLLDLTVLALTFSPDAARDQTGFAATTSGLYRTRNGGKSWRAVELPLDDPAVQCLAVSPVFARDRLVLAGTESDGLWRSDDGGTNWDLVPGLPAGGIGAVTFTPRDAESRHIAVATDVGVALSHDGGGTWRLTGEMLPPVLDLAFVPDDGGETLVAALYRDGIARLAMTDPNDEWVPANTGLRATALGTLVVSPDFDVDETLFAAGPEAGLRVSRDGGCTWVNAGGALTDADVYGVAISSNDGSGRLVFAATDAGIYRSRDGGTSWEAPAQGDNAPTGIVVTGATTVFAATLDNRLIASDDRGETWRALDAPLDGAVIVSLACAAADALGPTLYVGTIQPAPKTDAVTLWRSTDGGGSWARWLEAQGGAGTLPLAAPTGLSANDDDNALFIGLNGQVLQPRRNAWQTRGGARSPLWHGAALTTNNGDPVAITALTTSPRYRADGIAFAAASDGVHRSRDHGRTFVRWSEGLTRAPVLALAVTGDDPVLVFALGVDGTIWRRAGDLAP